MSDGRSLGEVVPARLSTARRTAQSMEHELLATISAGSRSAMAELYFLHFARLAKFFLHVTGRVDLVEELVNDTMFDVWRESARIASDTSVPAWIMGLAYSHGQMRLAGAGSIRAHVVTSVSFTPQGSAPTATSEIPRGQQDFLMKLPFEERAVLHLIHAGGFSRQSIADIMNTSCERVDVLLADARHRLGLSPGPRKESLEAVDEND
jgi:RNA polymerase sigma-70 factor (ECF subfamily)